MGMVECKRANAAKWLVGNVDRVNEGGHKMSL